MTHKPEIQASNQKVVQGLYSPDGADEGFWALKLSVIFARQRKSDHELEGNE